MRPEGPQGRAIVSEVLLSAEDCQQFLFFLPIADTLFWQQMVLLSHLAGLTQNLFNCVSHTVNPEQADCDIRETCEFFAKCVITSNGIHINHP